MSGGCKEVCGGSSENGVFGERGQSEGEREETASRGKEEENIDGR